MNERLETRKRRRSVSFLGVCEGIEKLFSNKSHCLHRLELSLRAEMAFSSVRRIAEHTIDNKILSHSITLNIVNVVQITSSNSSSHIFTRQYRLIYVP